MKNFFRGTLLVLVLVSAVVIIVKYYSILFAKTVIGQVTNIEKVTNAVAVVGGASNTTAIGSRELFSVAVLIKDTQGAFWTTSSEDRQWGIAEIGACVEARLFPYPPWQFEKAGTYYGARLVRVLACETIGLQPSTPSGSKN